MNVLTFDFFLFHTRFFQYVIRFTYTSQIYRNLLQKVAITHFVNFDTKKRIFSNPLHYMKIPFILLFRFCEFFIRNTVF